MNGMILARVADIEEFGILVVVVVRHDEEKLRAPAAARGGAEERRSGKAVGEPIDGVGESRKGGKL